MILIIPYKRLGQCNIDELAAQQVMNERNRRSTGGVLFARKDEHQDHDQKDAARNAILELLTLKHQPKPLSILTMPGLAWTFEVGLLRQREKSWRNQQMTESMRLTCVENDRFIYYSGATKMPGNKTGVIRSLPRPAYAERAMGNGLIDCYAFGNVDDLMKTGETFDFAWLDYTGPLTVERMKIIQTFWRDSVRDTLIVTSLKARWNRRTSDTIKRKGGCMNWLRASLPGAVVHEIEYQDGASPMVQFAVSKGLRAELVEGSSQTRPTNEAVASSDVLPSSSSEQA
jgi:hypothetical protein